MKERPGVRKALIGQAEELAMFKHMATLQPMDVARPADAPTNRADGAKAAAELGMKRLSERLSA